MKILAIDPGNVFSAYVILDENYVPLEKGKILNGEMFDVIYENSFGNDVNIDRVVIEEVRSYGMSVGQTVFDTCVWIGRFMQYGKSMCDSRVDLLCRKDVKMNLCGQTRAKDSNIIQALIDRFAYGIPNRGKGHKKTPGFFYGFRADIWQAYSVGVTYLDKLGE